MTNPVAIPREIVPYNEVIQDLTSSQLSRETSRLNKSTLKLKESNDFMQDYLNDPEIVAAIQENELVMERNRQKMAMLEEERRRREGHRLRGQHGGGSVDDDGRTESAGIEL